MADERSEAQLASAATWAGGATSENADREASWRRRSVDSKIERTTSIAAARDAPTTGARVATRRVESGRDDAGVRTHEPPPAGTRRAFDPPLAVEVSDLSLWVRPAFGGGTKPRAPFGVPFSARALGAKRGDAQSARTNQRVPPLDVEKADVTVRGGRALPFGEEGSGSLSSSERRREEKMVRVLRGVSFEALPGETTAILGPSGSGKTSLVTTIAGRLSARRGEYVVEGNVRFAETRSAPQKTNRTASALSSLSSETPSPNGYLSFGSDKSLARRVGFVTQDDCMFPSLTVQETVRYAAALRLPDDETGEPSSKKRRKRKQDAADAIVDALGLQRARDVPVGGAFAFFGRGVSGGERKRVAVAVEMLTEPSVLILDEPTSGLDATVALRLVRTLADLAKGAATVSSRTSDGLNERRNEDGRTIILTIHQPSSRVVKQFDATLFLARGRRAFYGDARGIRAYFASMNAYQDFDTNPAEFCVDVCNGEIGEYVGTDASRADESGVRGAETESGVQRVHSHDKTFMLLCTDDAERVVDIVAARSEKCLGRVARDGTVGATEKIVAFDAYEHLVTPPPKSNTSPPRFAVSWCAQTRVLLRRSLLSRRGVLFDALKTTQVVVVALLVGFLWFQRGAIVGVAAVGDVAGFLFFELLFLSFLTLFGSLFTFPDERAVICKERQSGAVRVSAYFVARSLADVPLDLFPPTLFVAIAYWLAGLRRDAAAFFAHVLLVYLAVLVASSLGLFVGATFPNTKQAQTVASVVMLAVMLTGGFYFDETPRWLDWTKKTSFINHAYAALLKTQFPDGGTFACFEDEAEALLADSEEESVERDGVSITGNRIVSTCRVEDTAQLSFVDLRESVWVNVGALLAVFFALRLATYLALRFVTLKPR
jgi:ABC-type multidrug transport system ATPase subunit